LAKKRIEREYGLIYIDKDNKKYLYKSYFLLNNLLNAMQTDDQFKKIEKKSIIIVRYIEGTTYILDLKDSLEGKL